MSQARRYCLKCWYVLDGLTSPRCPECGTTFDANNSKTFATEPRFTHHVNRVSRVALIALTFMLLELVCVGFVWETSGEIESGLLLFFVIVGNLVVLSSVFLYRPRLTTWLLITLVLITVPYPVFLRVKLIYLEFEAQNIIAYAKTTKVQTGSYPSDLSGYQFQRPWTSSNIQYTQFEGFHVSWWADQAGVSHWYTPIQGFRYYPD